MNYKLRREYTQDPQYALQEILSDRGVKDIDNFLRPNNKCELNPYDLDNIDIAAELLLKHLRANSHICIIIDADVDGFTSSSILWLYIKNIFPDADLSFTVHEHKQHGLEDKIDWLIDDEQFDLVICPDAASFDLKQHHMLYEINTDVLCLDHHLPPQDENKNDILPNPLWAVVVNNQISPNYSNKSLCGAGVVYKFCEVLDDKLGINQAHNYIDLAALGEIADVMDRTNIETNYIILNGLRNIKNVGFQTLLKAQSYSLKDKAIYPYTDLTSIDVAFYIAPLINAITRVGTITEKENMFYCFIEPNRLVQSTKRGAKIGDTEYAAEATARCGANAKARQNRIKEKALDLIDFKIKKNQLDENNIIIVEIEDSDGIPQEMTGLVAMAIVSKYHKPVMLGRRNELDDIQGSIRSDSNFAGLPSFKAFLEQSSLMNYVAGHENAGGWSLQDKRIYDLLDYANTNLDENAFQNCYLVDYILNADKDNKDLLMALAAHPEYFGNHIDEIKIIITDIPLSNIMIMGTNKDSIKISYNGIDYVRFKDLDFINDVINDRLKKLTVLARLNINEWQGQRSLQCFIDDYELNDNSHKYDF